MPAEDQVLKLLVLDCMCKQMKPIVAEDNSKKRVMSLLPVKTIAQMDEIRGYYSRSQFMQMAVDKFLENITEGEEKGKHG